MIETCEVLTDPLEDTSSVPARPMRMISVVVGETKLDRQLKLQVRFCHGYDGGIKVFRHALDVVELAWTA